MPLDDCNCKIVGSHITERIWKICFDDFLSKFAREEIVNLFTNYEVIKFFPRYDYEVDGVVTTIYGDNLLSELEVLKCKWANRWVLNQLL